MILTVTLNPAVDVGYDLNEFHLGRVNRCQHVRKTPGGKGLNVTRVANAVGVNIKATGFLGGSNGTFVREGLTKEGIPHDFLGIQGETRNCIAILHEGHQTELLESGPTISAEDAAAFLLHYDALLIKSSVVIASGSLPAGLPQGFYGELIRRAREKDVRFLLDTSGDALKCIYIAKPYLIKPNREELEQLTGKTLSDLSSVRSALLSMKDSGIFAIVTSLGSEGAIALVDGRLYRVSIPKINAVNPVGSGDAMMAGLAKAVLEGLGVEDMLRLGCVYGTLNALETTTGKVSEKCVQEFLSRTHVTEIET